MNIRNFDNVLKRSNIVFKSMNINSIDTKFGLTRLIHAIKLQYPELVQFIIEEHANLEDTGNGSFTPLMYAIQCRNQKICQLLIKNGANVFAKDNNGKTIQKYAFENGIDIDIDN